MSKILKVGGRGSLLSLKQVQIVTSMLDEHDVQTKVVKIKSESDQFPDKSITELGGKGVFARALDEQLLQGNVDLCVHSLKDLEVHMHENITIAAICKREDPRDVIVFPEDFVVKDKKDPLSALADKAKIGTGSPRRMAQISRYNANLQPVMIRGNIDTRLKKLNDDKNLDAIVIAHTALTRLGVSVKNVFPLSIDKFLPAIGQGAIGVTVRKNDEELITKLRKILQHDGSTVCCTAERNVSLGLKADCSTPLAALAIIKNNKLFLRSEILHPNGTQFVKAEVSGELNQAILLGRAMAQGLLTQMPQTLKQIIFPDDQGKPN